MYKCILKFDRIWHMVFLIVVLLKCNRRLYLAVIDISSFKWFSKRFQSSFIEHRTFNKIFNNQGQFSSLFVFNFEVEPLVMSPGIGISPHIEMKLFLCHLCYIFQIATLEVRLKHNITVMFTYFSSHIIKHKIVFMLFNELFGSIGDELLVEKCGR